MDNTEVNSSAVTMSDCYNYYGIPHNFFRDEICLVITNDGYINQIDGDGIFAAKKEDEYLKFGGIWLDFLNLFRTSFRNDYFLPLCVKMQNKYEDICLDFVKEFYLELFSISGCSSLVAQSIVDRVVFYAWHEKIKLSKIDFEGKDKWCFELLSFFNPKYALNDFECSPKEAHFKTTFKEIDGKPYLVHYNLEAHTLIDIDIINCRTHGIKILQCEHCHKFFIQEHGNNLKYCDKCKSLPDKERRNDEFENLYRKVYARLRNKSRSMIDDSKKQEYINGKFYHWTVEVIKQKKIYKQNDDFEGFKVYIEDAEKNIDKF